MSHANLQVLHYAVLENAPDIVRMLMAHGANARDGVYPHRDATTAYAIAVQRGYDAYRPCHRRRRAEAARHEKRRARGTRPPTICIARSRGATWPA